MSRLWKLLSGRYSILFKISFTFTAIFVMLAVLPKGGKFGFEYDRGKIWMHEDYYAPYDFVLLKSDEQLSSEKKEVQKSIIPVYKRDQGIRPIALESFRKDFDLRYKPHISASVYWKSLAFSVGLLNEMYQKGVVLLDSRAQRKTVDGTFQVVENNVSSYESVESAFTLEKAETRIKSRLIESKLPSKDLLLLLLKSHLQPNVQFNELITNKLEEQAMNGISLARGMVQKGELIVKKGSVTGDQTFQKLESLKKSLLDNDDRIDVATVAFGQFILLTVVMSLMLLFLYIFRKPIFDDNRKVVLIELIFVAMIAGLSLAIRLQLYSLYYIPYCMVPVIIRLLFDSRMALNIHLLVVIIAGFFVPNGFEFVFLQMTAGMIAIYSIRNLMRRSQFIVSAILILLMYIATYTGISILHQGSFERLSWKELVPFAVSTLLSLLAYPLIYVFERLFDVTSELTLMELTNSNSQILRTLALKAPGTFQHSMQVANLAEAASFNIGGNSLLIRAGAMYHDIGKMVNPEYFGENQNKSGYNPHDRLAFEESASIIIRHVIDGIEIAKKNNLPEIIIDFIRTHHGNTRVDYFYKSFLKNYPERELNERIFRYPGPVPFSKETAVLMLADSVEAASRTLREPDADSISALVDRIIDYKIEQNQLVNSDISLKDIHKVRKIFKDMLMGIYHVRIGYELEQPRAATV